jgi:hypothetical protein
MHRPVAKRPNNGNHRASGPTIAASPTDAGLVTSGTGAARATGAVRPSLRWLASTAFAAGALLGTGNKVDMQSSRHPRCGDDRTARAAIDSSAPVRPSPRLHAGPLAQPREGHLDRHFVWATRVQSRVFAQHLCDRFDRPHAASLAEVVQAVGDTIIVDAQNNGIRLGIDADYQRRPRLAP